MYINILSTHNYHLRCHVRLSPYRWNTSNTYKAGLRVDFSEISIETVCGLNILHQVGHMCRETIQMKPLPKR